MFCVLTVHRDDDVLVNVDDDTPYSSLRLPWLNAAAAAAAPATPAYILTIYTTLIIGADFVVGYWGRV